MENKAIAKQIKLFAQLLELHGENSFRTRAVANAAFTIDKLPFKIVEKTTAETNEYVIPLEEILKKGDFLNFKQQGFELQIFLKKEIIEQWKRN